MRLDKWLWAARFYKTRSLAQQAIVAGRVKRNGDRVKPAHDVKPGDGLAVRVGECEWRIAVRGLSQTRGPAPQAQRLYEETESSRAERQQRADQRRWGTEPSLQLKGRPTKRNRRLLEKFAGGGADPADDAEL